MEWQKIFSKHDHPLRDYCTVNIPQTIEPKLSLFLLKIVADNFDVSYKDLTRRSKVKIARLHYTESNLCFLRNHQRYSWMSPIPIKDRDLYGIPKDSLTLRSNNKRQPIEYTFIRPNHSPNEIKEIIHTLVTRSKKRNPTELKGDDSEESVQQAEGRPVPLITSIPPAPKK